MTDHTYNLATRLRAIASDSLYSFQPGRSTLTAEDLPDVFVTARFATHSWGISAQLWARNTVADLLASAEATAGPRDVAATILSRIRHFRSGNLLWTATSAPLPVTASTSAECYTAVGRHCYQIHAQPRIDAHPIWHLATDDLDTDHPLFAGVVSAVTYIDDTFEQRTVPVRRRRHAATTPPADAHPWRHTDFSRR
jgi:hypothetical protein